ncbi:MAG TPA: hypothetical protein VG738_02230 [Chitinophagaceae bacterium]|nr:hypothetical protein [Chitinophagaceae bacterium]
MTAQVVFGPELEKFKEYLRSSSVENARRALLYPLFQKLFKEKFKIENDAKGADVYVVGQLVVESKTDSKQWLEGLFQALHYHRREGLAFHTIMVVAREFIGIWKVTKLPEDAVRLSYKADVKKAPNLIGRELARTCTKEVTTAIQQSALYWLTPRDLIGDIFGGAKNLTTESYEILKILKNLDSDRFQINTHNFIHTIERMKTFFHTPLEAVHAFYTIVAYWDITSIVSANEEENEVTVTGFKGKKHSAGIAIHRNKIGDFTRFVETQYIFTNEGSGLTADYYFSRFDEVLAIIDPAYVKQHGIFFTNNNLSKFALWFAKKELSEDLNENYIVFDPAAGSGNLVSSWKGTLKHKIVSELQPDLLKIIERRMKADPWHVQHGFTIVPKTSNNEGLNFLDTNASTYLHRLQKEVERNHVMMDKPLAFLLNPPYKNTDEDVSAREATQSEYGIDKSIIDITGEDAGRERYLAFLGQILNMCKIQAEALRDSESLVLIFTPTSWLIPRPSYERFRAIWDNNFEFVNGFIITSNEFFKLDGKWPLAFTIWKFKPKKNSMINLVAVKDLTEWKAIDLNINWEQDDYNLDREVKRLLKGKRTIRLDNSRGYIKNWIGQSMYDFKRDKSKEERESSKPCGGLPLKDERRGNKKTYGVTNSQFCGFMDDATPCRVKQDKFTRHSNKPDRIWFRLDDPFKDGNKSKCFSGAPDKYGYCAFDLVSAKSLCSWFAITKTLNGRYPVWANQYDIWKPVIPQKRETYWYSLCFAFVLAENRCIVTKFEKNNPVTNAPDIYIDNPLSPNNKQSFWCTVLEKNVIQVPGENPAKLLMHAIIDLYMYWNRQYCKGQTLEYVGLQNEAYFKYFHYPDFVTQNSGLIQIKKYAEQNVCNDLLNRFSDISKITKSVKDELFKLLVEDFNYFE